MPNKEEFNGFDDDIFSPEEFENEDEEIEVESESNGNDEQVDENDDSSQTEEETDEQAEVQEESETDEQEKADSEANKNAYYANLRRQREAEEKAKREKEIKEAAKLEAELGLIKKNPYTNEPIIDEEDLKIYKLQKEIDENGGDPITDLPKAMAEANRKEVQQRKAQVEKDQAAQNKLAEEANELFAKYPEAIGSAQNDQELLDLMANKSGRWTMLECYEYLQMTRKSKKETKAKVKVEQKKGEVTEEISTKMTKTPSSQSNGGKASKSYLDMTDEEYLNQEAEDNDDFF